MSRLVEVEFAKWDGSRHWHYSMHQVGSDEHGIWLAAPALTVVQRGDEPANPHPYGFVKLVPERGWWTAIFNTTLIDYARFAF